MKWLLLMVVLCCISVSNVAARDLQVITAEWAPYNMMENGKLTGVGTEIVAATLERAGIETDIRVYPWARAYRMALKEPNILVYTIIRIPERELLFKWVGPIVSVKSVLHRLKKRNDIVLNSLEDAKKYTISTTRNAAGHQFLLKHGFRDHKHVYPQNTNKRSVELLLEERVDLESSVELNFLYEAQRLGASTRNVEQAWLLFENQGYIAFSLSTPDEVVEQVRQAFEQIKAEGIVDEILRKYLTMYRK